MRGFVEAFLRHIVQPTVAEHVMKVPSSVENPTSVVVGVEAAVRHVRMRKRVPHCRARIRILSRFPLATSLQPEVTNVFQLLGPLH